MDIPNPSSRGHHIGIHLPLLIIPALYFILFFSLHFSFCVYQWKHIYIKPHRFITVHGKLCPLVDIWSWPETSNQGYTSIFCMNYLYYCGQKNSEIRKISQNISHTLILNCTLPIYLNLKSTRVIWPKKKVNKEMFTRFPSKHKARLEHTPLILKWKFPYGQKSKIQ